MRVCVCACVVWVWNFNKRSNKPLPQPSLSPLLSGAPCRVAALGLAAGVLLVLMLFCLYRILCPRNYGQNGVAHGRRRRGDLPCDDYGYSPPVSEISPLLLRGHSMVSVGAEGGQEELVTALHVELALCLWPGQPLCVCDERKTDFQTTEEDLSFTLVHC